ASGIEHARGASQAHRRSSCPVSRFSRHRHAGAGASLTRLRQGRRAALQSDLCIAQSGARVRRGWCAVLARPYARWWRGSAEHRAEPVPLHIRQAPTPLMKELGYGEGYKYAFDAENAYLPQEYLPESLRGSKWYRPSEFGYEKTVRERIDWWEKLKRDAAGQR